MQDHLDAEEIVDLITEPGVVRPHRRDHLDNCTHCQRELMKFGRVIAAADLARANPELAQLVPPPDGLRERILSAASRD
jgi:hypothetical protein